MKKKLFSIVLSVFMMFVVVFSATACGGGGEASLVTDEKTINVRVRNAGYGTTYIEKLAEQFNKTFENEGYKVNVLPAREDLVGENVLRNIYSDSGIDVYFTDSLTSANLANHKEYGQTGMDITELVWNKKPIKFDGTEEELTVSEKLSKNFDVSNLSLLYNDKCYGLPFAAPFSVLAVNKRVLEEYGLDLPRTTDEMFYCFDKIMEKAKDDTAQGKQPVFPVTYSLSNNNYMLSVLHPWLAQYNGVEEFNKFWSWEEADGTPMGKESYKVFGYDSVKVMLEVMYRFSDYNVAAWGSGSQDFKSAQAQIMKGEAVFYSVGDWMFNEEFYGFPQYRNDVTCISAPVVSALGTKLFGEGSKYGFNFEKADDVLSCIIKYCDQGKLAEEIKPLVDAELSVNIDLADVTTVCERRGIVRCSIGCDMIMNVKSTKKDISALFMRFCTSTDAGKIFAQEARTSSPWALGSTVESEYAWIQGQQKISNNRYFTPIRGTDYGEGYRLEVGVYGMFPSPLMNNSVILVDILEEKITKYDDNTFAVIKDNSIYKTAMETRVSKMVQQAKEQLESEKWKPIG